MFQMLLKIIEIELKKTECFELSDGKLVLSSPYE